MRSVCVCVLAGVYRKWLDYLAWQEFEEVFAQWAAGAHVEIKWAGESSRAAENEDS